MVVFDLPTLLAITVFTSGVAGCLLLLSWLQHRRVFCACSVGIGFHHRGHRHDVDHRTQDYLGLLVDCRWKRDARRGLRNRLERRA